MSTSGNSFLISILFLSACGGAQAPSRPAAGSALGDSRNGSTIDEGPRRSCSRSHVEDTVVSDPETGNSYEPTVAASPNGTVVVSYFTFPHGSGTGTEIGYRVSKDFGASWSDPHRIRSPRTAHAADSVLAHDAGGNFYLAFLANQPNGVGDAWVYVAKLPAGSSIFETPVLASLPAAADRDKTWLFVDNISNIFAGYAVGRNHRRALKLDKSIDGGMSFAESTVAAGMADVQIASMCQDRSGAEQAPLYLVYWSHFERGFSIQLRRSTDAGQNWSAPATVATQAAFSDPTCVASGNDVWVVYGKTLGQDARAPGRVVDSVQMVHSADGGASFGTPTAVSDGYSSCMLPRIASSGDRLHVVYYQGPYGWPLARLKLASSSDGATWTRTTIANMIGTLTQDRGLKFIGDYIGLDAPGNWVFAAYVDNTTSAGPEPNEIHVVSLCAN